MGISLSRSYLIVSSTGNTVVVTGTGTTWSTSAPTFSLTGGAGASISAQTIDSDTQATLSLSAGSLAGALVVHDPSSSSTASLSVVENVALTGSASDSSHYAGHPAANAIDGNASTFYSSDAASGYTVTVDLLEECTVFEVRAVPPSGYEPRVASLPVAASVSADLSSPTLSGTTASTIAAGEHGMVSSSSGVRARYVRVGPSPGPLSIAELQVHAVRDAAPAAPPSPTVKIVFDGNSLTVGVGGSQSYAVNTVSALANAGFSVTSTNTAVSGQTTAQMLTRAPVHVDPAHDATRDFNVYVAWEGINDLYFGASVSQAYSHLVTVCQGRRAAGFKVVVGTLTPRQNTGTPAGQEASRLAVNALLRASWTTFADALADIGASSPLGVLATCTNPVYYDASDLVHFTDVGYDIVAGIVAAAIQTIVSPAAAQASTGAAPSAQDILAAFKADPGFAALIASAYGQITATPPSSYPGTGTLVLKDHAGTPIETYTLSYDVNQHLLGRTVVP